MEAQQERKERLNGLARQVYFAALEVHKILGPGLLEKAYEKCLIHELALRDVRCIAQAPLSISYKGLEVANAYYMDLLVEGELVIELKSTEFEHESQKAQLLTYLRLGNFHLGILINFKGTMLKDNFHRVVNDL